MAENRHIIGKDGGPGGTATSDPNQCASLTNPAIDVHGIPRDSRERCEPRDAYKTGKMVPGDNGKLVEQIVYPSSGRLAWPYDRSAPRPERATIYFIGPVDGPIKIGWASRLKYRLRDLELANAFPLHVWATVEAEITLEREYHKRFAEHRLHGEWFERHPDILAEIERLASRAAA